MKLTVAELREYLMRVPGDHTVTIEHDDKFFAVGECWKWKHHKRYVLTTDGVLANDDDTDSVSDVG